MTIRRFLLVLFLFASVQLTITCPKLEAADNFKMDISFPLDVDMTAFCLPLELEDTDRMTASGNVIAAVERQRDVKINILQFYVKHTHFVFRPSGHIRVDGKQIDGMVKVIRDSGLENIGIDLTDPRIHADDSKRFAPIESISLVKLDDSARSKSFVDEASCKRLKVVMLDSANASDSAEILQKLSKCKTLTCLWIDARKPADAAAGLNMLGAAAKFKSLVMLEIRSKPLNLDSLAVLRQLKKLRWLGITCPVRDGKPCDKEDVQKVLPGVDILLREND